MMQNFFGKIFLLAFLNISLVLSLYPQGAAEWSESKRKKGVVVFIRPFPNSNIDEFLGRTEVDATIAQVIAILSDPNSCKTMYNDCKELTLLSGTDKKNTVYVRNGAPWPVNDRDVVMERTFEQNDKNLSTVMKMKRTESVNKPSPSGVTRMDAFDGIWRMVPQSNGKLKVEYQAHFEPGGSVPQSVINLVLTDTPYETLLKLRKLIEEGKHKDAKYDWIKEQTNNTKP
ncbi:START domain-containing protein [Leptospira sp. 96542]|nr:START domain-containing protein [Leptospira sp. 96542]